MWIFGYGSLMWDDWEHNFNCTRKILATINGYCRRFSKPSVRNWGTKLHPCPTLNLVPREGLECRGLAFEFSLSEEKPVLHYLEKREGKNFSIIKCKLIADEIGPIHAYVSLYTGTSSIKEMDLNSIVNLALKAKGTDGQCTAYISGIHRKLKNLGISDDEVDRLAESVFANAK